MTNRIGIYSIALVSLGYIVFSGSFAELRVQLPFLDFPIFIGELLLIACLVLFLLKSSKEKSFNKTGILIWSAYLAFVCIKAVSGYWSWGALAFRDAALFYYPLFGLFGYTFWSRGIFGRKARRTIFALIMCLLIFRVFYFFWPMSLLLFAVLVALQESGSERMLLLSGALLLAPYEALFPSTRTVVLASISSTVFLIVATASFLKICGNMRFICVVLFLMLSAVFILKMTDAGIWRTLDARIIFSSIMPAKTIKEHNGRGKLFNPNWTGIKIPVKAASSVKVSGSNASSIPTISSTQQSTSKSEKVALKKEISPLNNKIDNARFRFYIWRDMAIEYWQKKPLFGFDFGYPLRSPTIEHLRMGEGEWSRDGWVGAHNSFLYIIYRGGIVGVVMIGFILTLWIELVIDFIYKKSIPSVLLCTILLNWLVSANFFLILELPYTAIPFWTIFGATIKYRKILFTS
jgi:hypothetical protein